MRRRTFLRYSSLIAGHAAFGSCRPLFASQQCSTAQPTPYGPMQQCAAGVPSVKFQPAFSTQHASEWCWAACISMVFSYYGHPVSQERIVHTTWGQITNQPGQPEDILRDLNRQWTDDNARTFTAAADAVSANNFNAVLDLRQDQPLIGSHGHAMILTALTTTINTQTNQWQITDAIVRDPWPYSPGTRSLSPQEWYAITFGTRIRVS